MPASLCENILSYDLASFPHECAETEHENRIEIFSKAYAQKLMKVLVKGRRLFPKVTKQISKDFDSMKNFKLNCKILIA